MRHALPTLNDWHVREKHFAENAYDGEVAPPLLVQEAEHSLILTAVHAVNHYRDDVPKVADLYTGSLVLFLAERLGCNAALNTHKHPAMNCTWGTPPIEAWLSERAPALQQPRVLDVHGARDNDEFDIALGTGGVITAAQEAWLNGLMPALEGAGFNVALNVEGYAALSPRSLTQRIRVQGLAVTPLQIEITRRWRSPEADLERTNQMLATLHAALSL